MQHLNPNTLLKGGEYKIEKVLGQGGFGITYLAEQVNLKRKVAIKEFFIKELCNRDETQTKVSVGSLGSVETVERFKTKFLKEARNIAKLNHSSIVRVIDVFEENGTAYYVMEYLEGGSLGEMIKSKGALSETEALRYIRQVADALAYIHEKKLNHLDVKPGNKVLNEKGESVLIDFGMSKQYDATTGNQTSTTPIGISEGYAPLEQYKQGGVNEFSPQADIYALGATLYKLVTGVTPPNAIDVSTEGLPKLPGFISSTTAAAIQRSMKPSKVNRPQNISDFLDILSGKDVTTDTGNTTNNSEETKLIDSKDVKVETPPPFKPQSQHQSTHQDNPQPPKRLEDFKETKGNDTDNEKDTTIPVQKILAEKKGKETISQNKSRKKLLIGSFFTLFILLFGGIFYYGGGAIAIKAHLGDVNAQYDLGERYYSGKGVTQNFEKSKKWLTKAAEQGNAEAQNKLGECCLMSHIVDTTDSKKGVEWFTKAAQQGNAKAMSNLGECYYNGVGVKKDLTKAKDLYDKAAKWYTQAAQQGNIKAQCDLGECYLGGRGVPQNFTESIRWFTKSAEQGYADAQNWLGWCYQDSSITGGAQDHTKAVEWYKKAAQQEHAKAMRNLGECYYNGWGVPQNYSEAVKWYRKAAKKGEGRAQGKLGDCYYEGVGVSKDTVEAMKWWEKGREQGVYTPLYLGKILI